MGRAEAPALPGVYFLKTREVMQRAQGHPAGRTGGPEAGVGIALVLPRAYAWAAPARMRGSWPRQAQSPALEHSCVN